MLARKLDVQRAVALFEQHELIRKEEDLDNIDPTSDPLRSELETGKFTILVSFSLVYHFSIYNESAPKWCDGTVKMGNL